MQSNNLKDAIIEKYGSVKRFSEISGMSYSMVYNCIIGKNKIPITEIEKLIDINLEKMRDVEVTSELIKNVRQFIYKNYKTNSEFCIIHKIPYTWLSLFLNGRVKFKNKRILHIESIINNK